MTYTNKMHDALRRDTEGKQNATTDLLDEVERLRLLVAELKEDAERLFNDDRSDPTVWSKHRSLMSKVDEVMG